MFEKRLNGVDWWWRREAEHAVKLAFSEVSKIRTRGKSEYFSIRMTSGSTSVHSRWWLDFVIAASRSQTHTDVNTFSLSLFLANICLPAWAMTVQKVYKSFYADASLVFTSLIFHTITRWSSFSLYCVFFFFFKCVSERERARLSLPTVLCYSLRRYALHSKANVMALL